MSIALISSILTAKFGESITLDSQTLIPHPADIFSLDKWKKSGQLEVNYVYKYEAFEIRSKNKVYSHILAGTVDTANDSFLQFETDMDLNNSVMSLGAAKSNGIIKYNNVTGYMRRKVILGYADIDSIEYILVHPINP